jgi:xylose isomerase
MAVDYAEEDRLHRPVPHRAEAEGADQAPVRLRRAACINFLRPTAADHFKLNIETNHATLAGHTMMHELDYAAHRRACSARSTPTRGDLLLGWDTDQFPTDST